MIFSAPSLHDGARWKDMRVGILGGSFDPPHEGHVHASLSALNSLKLDVVWWLVSPQNPLKNQTMHDFGRRFEMCFDMTRHHPQLLVTNLEKQFETNLTWQTIRKLKVHFPMTEFVWISGLDNALTMHKWQNWRDILTNVATAHVARPPAWSLIEQCPLKMIKDQRHIVVEKASNYSLKPQTSYWLMQKKMMDISSTDLRHKG